MFIAARKREPRIYGEGLGTRLQSPYKRGGGGGRYGQLYFYTFCTFLTFGALSVGNGVRAMKLQQNVEKEALYMLVTPCEGSLFR